MYEEIINDFAFDTSNIVREFTLSEPDENGERSIDTVTILDPTKRMFKLKNKSIKS